MASTTDFPSVDTGSIPVPSTISCRLSVGQLDDTDTDSVDFRIWTNNP